MKTRSCNTCRNWGTRNCPNSIFCASRDDKPFYQPNTDAHDWMAFFIFVIAVILIALGAGTFLS